VVRWAVVSVNRWLLAVRDEGDASQTQMTVCRPTRMDVLDVHEVQADGIGQGEILVGESPQHPNAARLLVRSDRGDAQRRQRFDQRDELQRAGAIVPLQEPSMPLCNDQRRGQQRWRLGKESTEELVIAVGPIGKSDERRGVDVGLSLSAHRPRRRPFAMSSDRPFL